MSLPAGLQQELDTLFQRAQEMRAEASSLRGEIAALHAEKARLTESV